MYVCSVFVLVSGPTLSLDTRMSHAVLNERYHLDKQTSLDRDGRQCMSAGIAYSYCRLRPVLRDTDHFLQVAMGLKQWDCVSFTFSFTLIITIIIIIITDKKRLTYIRSELNSLTSYTAKTVHKNS